ELVRAFQMALAKNQRILAAIESLSRLAADPVSHLVPSNRAQWNEQQQFRKMYLSSGGEHSRGNQKGITGKEKSDKKTSLDENDHTYQQRAARLDQALDVKQELKKMLERSDHENPSPTLADSPEEDSRRLHTYTVTENERILIAEFPLQGQHDNDGPRKEGSLHMLVHFGRR